MEKLLNRVNLAMMLLDLKSAETDKGMIVFEKALEVGTGVFVKKDGKMEFAEDGEYVIENTTYTVKEGKVESFTSLSSEVEPENEPENEPVNEPVNEPEAEEVKEPEAEEVNEPAVEAEPEAEPEAEEPKEPEAETVDVSVYLAEIDSLKATITELNAKIAEQDKLLNESMAFSAHEEVKETKNDNTKPTFKTYFK